jgi:hypothetical protein
MNSDFLDTWITRAKGIEFPAPRNEDATARLAALIAEGKKHILVAAGSPEEGDSLVLDAIRRLSKAGASVAEPDPLVGWLAVDIPLPHRMDATALVHRMVRRLYFTAVLHGLAELPALRDVVQSLRVGYLQTRGTLLAEESASTKKVSSGEAKISINPLKLGAKLTAAEEVAVAEKLASNMTRPDLFETEDQLLADIGVLTQLHLLVDIYLKDFRRDKFSRIDAVAEFFRSVYADIRNKRLIKIKPVFVFRADCVMASISILGFFGQAAGVASARDAKVIVVANPIVATLWDNDAGLRMLRSCFDLFRSESGPAPDATYWPTCARELINAPETSPEMKALLKKAFPGQ